MYASSLGGLGAYCLLVFNISLKGVDCAPACDMSRNGVDCAAMFGISGNDTGWALGGGTEVCVTFLSLGYEMSP